MENIVIYGNGSVADVTYFSFLHDSPHSIAAFTVDRDVIKEKEMFGLPVIPFDEIESSLPPEKHKIHIAIGYTRMNKLRAEKYSAAQEKGYGFASYISSKAVIGPEVILGENCFIGPNTVIQPFVTIGNNVLIRENCTISHNSNIMDHCFISGSVGISGNVTVEPCCFLGTNSTVRDNIRIGRECLIGAGVTLLYDTQEKEVYMNKQAQKLPFPSDKLT